MDDSFVKTHEVQALFDTAAGIGSADGSPRVKAIMRDIIEAAAAVIVRHDVSESEFWQAVTFLQQGADEFGLLVAGTGLEHFLDLFMDAKDAEAGLTGGTPRTIEGPLYVAGAPLVEGDVNLSKDPDDTGALYMNGRVTGPDGEPVPDVILHVWHANSKGWYSHFDPTGEQTPFNNRARIKLGPDGRYSFHSRMPNGYSVPPGGATDVLMQALGRHGNRPAHVHFFIEAPGYRTLTTQINFGDDPFARDDFAFGTREGLLPVPQRQGDSAYIAFDFSLQRAAGAEDEQLSARSRAAAEPALA
ncbi:MULTISPECIES: dioxygenase [unclassified Novosphingobium]|uniref:dioxygenase family protein n=1 Tax=unclassified Novosphingobium TaxID=2644732 RepID=UPI00146E8CAC|nr:MULTISPECIES: dioxygenase [unclassified Novosphingobium]NMN04759.1 catechol 1,2-dioxygenase [Novosphingobium sp. SG919]NMN85247.1 catechol 1,2-dioxygenase [Novosphingobium sp. SG916]